jgi:chromosomal replication initiation ATPase DnaA
MTFAGRPRTSTADNLKSVSISPTVTNDDGRDVRGHQRLDVATEMRQLQERKDELMRLIKLQNEVSRLECVAAGHRDSTIGSILDIVCRHFAVTPDTLRSRCRTAYVAWARHVFCYMVRANTKLTQCEIGVIISRCHENVFNSCRAVTNRMDTDPAFATEVNALLKELNHATP